LTNAIAAAWLSRVISSTEAIGLVFEVTLHGQRDRRHGKRCQVHQQENQRQRRHVRQLAEAEPIAIPLHQPARRAMRHVECQQDQHREDRDQLPDGCRT
jgi:hypothetical protein